MKNPPVILLVEDEHILGEVVRESLETRGYKVIYCSDGDSGWKAFREIKPHLCVLDVVMPQKDGFTLAREIRAVAPRLPIIFLTSRSQTEDVVKGFEAGANDYVKKPFSMKELIVRIDALLQRDVQVFSGESEDEEIFRIGEYLFEPKRQKLCMGTYERKLTHRESELLRLLFLNRNQVLGRTLVLEELWGDDNFFNARSMDVFITKLRKYLRLDPQVEIVNVRGLGYKLIF